MNKLVSIIVPVYNTGRYLEEALDAILSQSYTNFEAIIVNDGSTDNSKRIIDRYCALDRRIQALNQKNIGVAEARNAGLRKASGEYVVFWDSDDRFPSDALETLYNCITENNADLVCGAAVETSLFRSIIPKGALYLSEKDEIDKYDVNIMYTLSVCNKMFRLDIIKEHNLQFRNLKFLEDGDFLMRYIEHADKICGCSKMPDDEEEIIDTDRAIYEIRIRPSWAAPSATQQGSEKMFDECREAIDCIEDTIKRFSAADREKLIAAGADEDALAEIQEKSANLLDALYYRLASVNLINSFYRLIWRNNNDYTIRLNRSLSTVMRMITEQRRQYLIENNPDLDLTQPLPGLAELDADPILTVVVRASVRADSINDVLAGLYSQKLPAFNIYVSKKLMPGVSSAYLNMGNLHFFSGLETLGISRIVRNTTAEFITVMDKPALWEPEGFRKMYASMTNHPDRGVYKADYRDEVRGTAPVRDLNHRVFRTELVRERLNTVRLKPLDVFKELAREAKYNHTQLKGKARVYVGNLEILK